MCFAFKGLLVWEGEESHTPIKTKGAGASCSKRAARKCDGNSEQRCHWTLTVWGVGVGVSEGRGSGVGPATRGDMWTQAKRNGCSRRREWCVQRMKGKVTRCD